MKKGRTIMLLIAFAIGISTLPAKAAQPTYEEIISFSSQISPVQSLRQPRPGEEIWEFSEYVAWQVAYLFNDACYHVWEYAQGYWHWVAEHKPIW